MKVLTTLSDRVISQKIGTSAELNDAHKTIDKLNLEIEGLNSEIDLLEDTIEDKDELIANIEAAHLKEIDDINLEHSELIEELNQSHNSELELLNKDHLAEIDAINLGYIDRDNELMVIINDINTLL